MQGLAMSTANRRFQGGKLPKGTLVGGTEKETDPATHSPYLVRLGESQGPRPHRVELRLPVGLRRQGHVHGGACGERKAC